MADDTLALLTRQEAYEAINDPASAIEQSSTRDVEIVDMWVPAVSRRIDDLCGPVVARTITEELHDGGVRKIWLHHTPIYAVTSVTEYDDTAAVTLTAETNAAKPSDAYLADGPGRYDRYLLRRSDNADAMFESGRRNVVVTYEAGRFADTASVDAKFKLAAASILRRLWSREAGAWARGGDPFAEAGAGSVGFFKAVDPMVSEFLGDEMRINGIS